MTRHTTQRRAWISESSSVQPQIPSSAHMAAVHAAVARRQRCGTRLGRAQLLAHRARSLYSSCSCGARGTTCPARTPRVSRRRQLRSHSRACARLCRSRLLLFQHRFKLSLLGASERRVRQVDAVCAGGSQRAAPEKAARALTVTERRVQARCSASAAAAQLDGAAWRAGEARKSDSRSRAAQRTRSQRAHSCSFGSGAAQRGAPDGWKK